MSNLYSEDQTANGGMTWESNIIPVKNTETRPSLIAKEEAETEAIRKQIVLDERREEAEIARVNAETAKFITEQASTAAVLEQQHIELALVRHNEDERYAGNHYNNVYVFDTDVTDPAVKACMEQLMRWHRMEEKAGDDPKPIELILQSPGGSIVAGFALYDHVQYIRRLGHYVTTTALGMAASMAGVLLQAGDTRVMGADAFLLIHEGGFGAVGSVGEVEDRLTLHHKMQERILGIFADRSKLSQEEIAEKWKRKDWWLDSTEALKLGFVDEVK